MRDQVKLKVIEALDKGSLDESKYKEAVGDMVDLIINQAKFELSQEFKEYVKSIEKQEPPKPEVEHRSFGKVRNPGDPKRGGSL